MELDVIHQMVAHECAVDVSGLSLALIYKYGEEAAPLLLTASGRGLFVFKCLVIILCLFICMCA